MRRARHWRVRAASSISAAIEPRAMFWCVMDFEATKEASCLWVLRLSHTRMTFFASGYCSSSRCFIGVRPVGHGAMFVRSNAANSCFWLVEHEDTGGSVSFVFMVKSLGLAWFHRQRFTGFLGELYRLLVHTNNRNFSIIRTMIDFQYIFHRRDELGILLRGNHPAFAILGFEFVFFRTSCTVFAVQCGTIFSSTTRSDSNCNVQRVRPGGAALHAPGNQPCFGFTIKQTRYGRMLPFHALQGCRQTTRNQPMEVPHRRYLCCNEAAWLSPVLSDVLHFHHCAKVSVRSGSYGHRLCPFSQSLRVLAVLRCSDVLYNDAVPLPPPVRCCCGQSPTILYGYWQLWSTRSDRFI